VAILLKEGLLEMNKVTRFGWTLFAVGFILKELTLFIQGTLLWMKKGFMPHYYEIILSVTAILPIALLSVLIGQWGYKKFQLITVTNSKIE